MAEEDFQQYLKKYHFDKRLEQLNRQLKNKTIIIYGAGMMFEAIKQKYDLSELNIIAIADKRFCNHEAEEEFLGYKVCSPGEIIDLKPDVILVATKFYLNIIEELYFDLLKETKIKIKPLIKKNIFTLIYEALTR